MNKKYQVLLGLIFFSAFSFVAGGLAYRAGFFSLMKSIIVKPEIQEIIATPILFPAIILTESPDFEYDSYYELVNDTSRVSMNKIELNEIDESPLKFLVAGHLYGRPDDDDFHPALTFISNLGNFRNSDLDMMVFLGDTSRNHFQNDFDDLEYFILNQIDIPVFNAVGNHDMNYGEDYQKRYGKTVYAFEYKNNLFIVLDTNIVEYDLSDEEIIFIDFIVNQFVENPKVENIHIFMHHVLFLNEEEITNKQISSPNSGNGISERFRQLLTSVIFPASANKSFYFYAGDVGAFKGNNLSPFYKKDPLYDVTFIATGIGNWETDSVLIVEETMSGIEITPFSLWGIQMSDIEDYDFEYWFNKPQP